MFCFPKIFSDEQADKVLSDTIEKLFEDQKVAQTIKDVMVR